MVPKNLLQLSREEKQKFVDSFDLVLHDCDGVLWTLSGVLPGIKEGVDALCKLNKSLGFVSNNSISDQEKYEAKFSALGIKFDYKKQLIHPADSIVAYLNKINFDKSKTIYLIGSAVHKTLLEENGYKFIVGRNAYETPDLAQFYKALFADCKDLDIGAVCLEVDLDLNIGKLYMFEYFANKHPDCLVLLGGTDLEYYIYDYSFMGLGHFINQLTSRFKQKPIVVGKPGEALGEIMMSKYAIEDPSRVLFIGDTLEQDIGFAKKNGFQTLLVLTGATTNEMLEQHDKPEEVPDYVTQSMFDFDQVYKDLRGE